MFFLRNIFLFYKNILLEFCCRILEEVVTKFLGDCSWKSHAGIVLSGWCSLGV